MKKFIAFLLVSVFIFCANAQNTDSLQTIINSGPKTDGYIDACLDMAVSTVYSNSDTSLYFARKLLDKTLNPELNQQLRTYKTIGTAWVLLGNYDSALFYMGKSLESGNKLVEEFPEETNYLISLSGTYGTIATIYYYLADYQNALKYNFKSLELSEQAEFWRGISICQSNIGNINLDIKNSDKAIKFYRLSLQSAKNTGDIYDLSQPYNNLGLYYLNDSAFDSARYYINKCININEQLELETELAINYQNMAKLFFNIGEMDSALYYAHKGLNLSNKLNKIEGKIINLVQLGEVYSIRNQDTAIAYLNKALDLSKQSNMDAHTIAILKQLISIYKRKDNYKTALKVTEELNAINDKIFNAEKDKNIAELETKYETAKNEAHINMLEQKSEFMQRQNSQNRLLYLLIIAVLVLIVVSIVFYLRNIGSRQKAEREKLQKEAERKLLETVIETEYKERRRFAEDLHDSLGVLLSTLKLYINEINTKRQKSERQELVEQSNKMLDDAIKNARQISNNIMPAVIKYNGFYSALTSFADRISSSGKINISLANTKFNQKLKPSVEISLYRIITEFINNTIKHAEAKNIKINLIKKNGTLYITYQDDGKGFDINSILKSKEKGLGLLNSINRIKTMGGNIELKSEKGFFAGIQLNINNYLLDNEKTN